MRALSAAEFLDVWEHGRAQAPAQRALTLLALAGAKISVEELARCSVGQRDAHLLALRERTFGSRLASVTVCPACAEEIEFQVEAGEIRTASSADPEAALRVNQGDCSVEFRVPTSGDLTGLDPAADRETNRRHLLERCLIAARRADADVPAAELPADIVATIAQRMAEADPQADVHLALACPRCQHAWQTPFDIVSYFWSEIQVCASRLLREVHALASAYGWHESQILALSPGRRQAYLELIGA